MKHYPPSSQQRAFANDYGCASGTIGLKVLERPKWSSVVSATIIEHSSSGYVSFVQWLDRDGYCLFSTSFFTLLDGHREPIYVPLIGEVIHYGPGGEELSRDRELYFKGVPR